MGCPLPVLLVSFPFDLNICWILTEMMTAWQFTWIDMIAAWQITWIDDRPSLQGKGGRSIHGYLAVESTYHVSAVGRWEELPIMPRYKCSSEYDDAPTPPSSPPSLCFDPYNCSSEYGIYITAIIITFFMFRFSV